MIWRVDREMVLLLAGGRALLMQLAHPKVAAGVAEHSDFRNDPFGRLRRTMGAMWSIVFDAAPAARASLARVRGIHEEVRGGVPAAEPLPSGTPYDALDPELLLWVHATLVDSAMLGYQLFVKALSPEEKRAYYDGTKKLARLFGIPESSVPPSLEAFDCYLERMLAGEEIAVGAIARALAADILYPRPLILKIGSPWSRLITVALLPERLRAHYGLTWNEPKAKIFRLLAAAIRCSLPLVPAPVRVVPNARAAEQQFQARRTSFYP